MKLLTALLLMLSLVLPVGALTVSGPVEIPAFCTVIEADGSACCEPAAVHCCCSATPEAPAPAPQPAPASPNHVRDLAAALPDLFLLTELPRLSEISRTPAPDNDRATGLTLPSVRTCVLRCSLLL
jgi:hypothetical protein